MADTREGLTSGEESTLDVNSDAGFNTLLAHQVAGDEELSDEAKEALSRLADSDTAVTQGLTYGEESRPRDEHGRFTPKEQPVAEPVEVEGAAPADEERETPTPDPVADFLARHGGDASAALSAALREKEEAQSLIGRHSAEVAEARKAAEEVALERARLEGRLEAQSVAPAATPVQYDRNQLEESISGPNGDGSGGEAAWAWAAQSGDRGLLEAVAEIWGEYQPFHAARRWNDFERYLEQYEREANKPEAPTPDPMLTQMRQERQFKSSLNAVKGQYDAKDWPIIEPHLEESLKSAHRKVLEMVGSDDPSEQQAGLEIVAENARVRAIAQATTQAGQAATAEKVASKKAASAATGSLRPVAERKPEAGEAMTKEQIRDRFYEQLLSTETASVPDGLTYGRS